MLTYAAGDHIYFMGIVDFLQDYNMRKYLETQFKSVRHKRAAMSSVPPQEYAQRFHAFMTQIME